MMYKFVIGSLNFCNIMRLRVTPWFRLCFSILFFGGFKAKGKVETMSETGGIIELIANI